MPVGRIRTSVAALSVLACEVSGCLANRATEEEYNREINVRRADPETGIPRWVEVTPGVNIPIGDFWKRYEAFFRIPPGDLERGDTRPDRLGTGMITSFEQVHLGYHSFASTGLGYPDVGLIVVDAATGTIARTVRGSIG